MIAINNAVPFKDDATKILLNLEVYDELETAAVRMFADLDLGRLSRVVSASDLAYLQKWADVGRRFYDERAVPGFFRDGPPVAEDDVSVPEYLRGSQPGMFGYAVSLAVMRDFFALADEYAQRYGEFCVIRYYKWPEETV